jgi:formylglycine-generating enzyme
MKTLYITLILFSFCCLAWADVFVSQSFEDSTSGSWNYTPNPAGMSRLVWWGRSDQPMGGTNAQSGSWYWASWDLDNIESSLTFDTISLPVGYVYTLSFYYYTNGLVPTSEYSKYCVAYDNGTNWSNWITLLPDTDAWTQVSITIPAYESQFRLKVATSHNGFGKYAHWDSIAITRTLAQPSAPIVYNTSVAQRTDGSGLVDIHYDLFDVNGDNSTISLFLSEDGGVNYNIVPSPAHLSGDIGNNITNGTGKHITWDAGAEVIDFDNNQYKFRITADDHTIPNNFVFVEGGTFNNATSNVTVSSFFMNKYELTQAEYQALMGSNPSNFQGVSNGPVEQVSWFNAIEYCNKRSLNDGLTPCYSYSSYGTNPPNWPSGWNSNYNNHTNVACNWTANGYRLPTEAEWEFAARGGNQTHNYTYSGSNDIEPVVWYYYNSNNTTHTVGTKTANELGLFDMNGNVSEWCWDIYDNYPSGAQNNPHGAVSGTYRVCRGGSYGTIAVACTVSDRNYNYATYSPPIDGFRICRNVDNFVLIEGGTFNNGTSDVTVSSFYLDKFELTQAGYQAIIGNNPATGYGVGSDYPVYNVSWFDAIAYCNKRSMNEGFTPCYSYSTYGTNPATWPEGWNSIYCDRTNISCNWTADGYRLPTEAEWEFAARGGNQTHGYTYSGSNNIEDVAWYYSNSGVGSHTVGTKTPNELCICDMSGNVWEQVWDYMGAYMSGPQYDPHGPESGVYPMMRGGGFSLPPWCSTVSNRDNPGTMFGGGGSEFGFRLCRVSP